MIAWLRLSLRRLADARGAALTLALFVALTAFVTAAAPRALDRAADSAFRQELDAARSSARNIALIREGRVPAGSADDPFREVRALAAELQAVMPPEVAGLIATRDVMVTTPRFTPGAGSNDRTVRLRFQPGARERVRLVRGRMPEAARAAGGPTDLATIEVALSEASSIALGLGVGSRRDVRADATDPLAGNGTGRVRIEVTGLIEPVDPTDAFWFDDRTLWEPTQRALSPEVTIADVTAWAPDAAYSVLMEATAPRSLPMRTALRSTVDAARLETDRLAGVTDGLRRMESVFPAGTAGPGATALRTQLLGILTSFERRWSAAQAMLAVMAIGVLTVVGAALTLVALLLAHRRRAAVGMWRWRGASRGQVQATLLAEGLLLTVPGAVAGAAVAIALLPAGPDAISLALAASVAVVAVAALLLAIPSTLVGPPHEQAREGDLPRAARPRRVAAEVVVIVLAIAGALLLRDRGVAGGAPVAGGPGAAPTPDPFIAAVPALLGLAVGLLTVRLFRVPLRAVAALAARRRDLVPALALRRVTRGGTSGPVLLVLLATVGVATFASVSLATLASLTERAAWGQVGAPFRITRGGEPFPATIRADRLPGVEATAGAWRAPAVIRQLGVRVDVLALDVAAWNAVVANTPLAGTLPPGMAMTGTTPLPVIVSSALADSATPVAVGDRFPLTVTEGAVDVEVVEIRDAFPGLAAGERFIVVNRDAITTLDPDLLPASMELYLRAPDAVVEDLRVAIAEQLRDARLVGRAETHAAIAASPIVSVVTAGLALTSLVAGIYAALAVAAALALTGAARAIEVARLRALGLSRREALLLDVLEHAPTVAVAFLVGVGLGVGTFLLLAPGLGTDTIVGWTTDVGLAVDPGALLVILAAMVGIVAAGILLAARIAGRVTPAAALRRAAE